MERFHDRITYDLAPAARRPLYLWVEDPRLMELLALASACAGLVNLVIVGDPSVTEPVRERVAAHLGAETEHPAIVRALTPLRALRNWAISSAAATWVVDAGITAADGPKVIDRLAQNGADVLYLGWERGLNDGAIRMGRYRHGGLDGFLPAGPLTASPACFSAASHLIIWALTLAGAVKADPPPPMARIPIGLLPPGLSFPGRFRRPFNILMAGGGGAIAHMVLACLLTLMVPGTAERLLDDELVTLVLADGGNVHNNCRARQVFYTREQAESRASKAEATAQALEALLPRARKVACVGPIDESLFQKYRFDFCFWSVDSIAARRQLSRWCAQYGVPFVSAGSHLHGGQCRLVDSRNPRCEWPENGVEGLAYRTDPPGALEDRNSCAYRPQSSSITPQLALADHAVRMFLACLALEDYQDEELARALARGIEVNLLDDSRAPGFEGLRYSPGQVISLRRRS